MKILVDTNVILDVLCNRRDFVGASSQIWKLCEVNMIEGYISALSVPNIVYILRKELTPQKTRDMVMTLSIIFRITDFRSQDLKNASDMYSSDFEDAVQMCQAKRIGADYIITRNINDFKDGIIDAKTPEEILQMIKQERECKD